MARSTHSEKLERPSRHDSGKAQEHRFWTPFYLRRRTLLLFALVFGCLAIILGILKLYSDRNDGLGTADSRLHYLWTYAPTAVFVLAAVFWDQTEYRAKQLQPWVLMRQKFQPASQSLLLDYISRWNVLAFVNAVRHHHSLAALAILGSLLLKLITVFSTGLFVLQTVEVSDYAAPLHVTESFAIADKAFWPAQGASIRQNASTGDFRPTTIVMALAKENHALPNGTTSHQAFQQFVQPQDISTKALAVQAPVDVFESSLHCEPATFNARWQWGHYLGYTTPKYHAHTVSSKSCINATKHDLSAKIEDYWYFWEVMSSSYEAVQCAEYPVGDVTGGLRMLFYTGKVVRGTVRRSVGGASFANYTGSANYTGYADIAALLCYPTYDVFRAQVTLDGQGHAVQVENTSRSTGRAIPGLRAWDLANAFFSSVSMAQAMIFSDAMKLRGDKDWGFTSVTDAGSYVYLWQLLNIVRPQGDVLNWSNTTLAREVLQSVWSTWSAQLASLHLKMPATHAVTGVTTAVQDRLVIRTGPFWLIEAGLLAMVLVAAVLLSTTPNDVLARDPGSLGGLALILASSKDLQAFLSGLWHLSQQAMRDALAVSQFTTSLHPAEVENRAPTFCIDPRRTTNKIERHADETRKKNGWWRSQASSKLYMIGAPSLLVALIILLEVLYHYSNTNNGIVSVTNPGSWIHFAYTTVPAAIMACTAAIVGKLHFAVQTLQPYGHLKRSPVPAATGLFRYPFSGSRSASIAETFKYREFAVVLTLISVFFSQFLTIVVSGLYTVHRIPTSESMAVAQTVWFRHNTTLLNNSPIHTESVTVGNLSFPRFTYEDLVLPTLTGPHDASGTLNLQIEGLRGSINCSIPPPGVVKSINNTYHDGAWTDIVNVVVHDEDGCFKEWQTSVPTQYNNGIAVWPPKGFVSLNKYMDISYQPPGFGLGEGGKYQGGEYYWFSIPPTGYFGHMMGSANRKGCPTSFGMVGRTEQHLVKEATFFTCYPFVKKVQVNASFVLPNMDIDLSAPPVVLSEHTEPFDVHFANPPAHGAPIIVSSNPLDAFQQFPLGSLKEGEIFGPFMDVLVYGTRGVPAKELIGVSNVPKLLTSVDRLYGVGFAQLMNGRRSSLTSDAIVEGTRISNGPHRLVQSEISTRILDGLLASILVCMVLACFTMETRKVLRLNPCSIAGMASLLVESELLTSDIIPDGAEWWSDTEVSNRGFFDGWLVSLGWWLVTGHGDEKRYGIGIGRADDSSQK